MKRYFFDFSRVFAFFAFLFFQKYTTFEVVIYAHGVAFSGFLFFFENLKSVFFDLMRWQSSPLNEGVTPARLCARVRVLGIFRRFGRVILF